MISVPGNDCRLFHPLSFQKLQFKCCTFIQPPARRGGHVFETLYQSFDFSVGYFLSCHGEMKFNPNSRRSDTIYQAYKKTPNSASKWASVGSFSMATRIQRKASAIYDSTIFMDLPPNSKLFDGRWLIQAMMIATQFPTRSCSPRSVPY